jgi:alpha-glucan phosphorylase-like protein
MNSDPNAATSLSTASDDLLDTLLVLADDLWWTTRPAAHALWAALDPALWEDVNHNPRVLLREAGLAGATAEWRRDAQALIEQWRAALARPLRSDVPRTAYFCMEYGLHESLPIYSGGLGMLAGDHLRSAADHDLDFVAVGFLWGEGYFRQVVHDGQQAAAYCPNQRERMAMKIVRGPDGSPVIARAPVGGGHIALQAWEVRIGKVRLFLLDADLEENPPELRAVTHRLYGGSTRTRVLQEVALGIGGARLLRAIGIEPEVFHMNEGHAAFLTLELWARGLQAGQTRQEAWDAVEARCVFTTHTPVPAGHDRFGWDLVDPILGTWRHNLGLHPGAFMDLGRVTPGDVDEPLCMTVLGMRGSRVVNGVSKLHGEVSREMWAETEEGPAITHITNGVHAGAWLAPETEALWDQHLPGWRHHLGGGTDAPAFWLGCEQLPVGALIAARDARRARLVTEIRRRLGREVLDPSLLTIGFARRFAPYKRGDLIFSDPDRLAALLARGAQLVFAGKAHPADVHGQAIVARVLEFARDPRFRDRVVFVPDYDMATGRLLTNCCDVWLNNPRRPREASGTSGQKAAMNGNLNLSVLDGWWPEGFDGTNGWSIGEEKEYDSLDEQDAADAEDLYSTLETEVLPAFADDATWARMSARAMATCAGVFNTHRMVADYIELMYLSGE